MIALHITKWCMTRYALCITH